MNAAEEKVLIKKHADKWRKDNGYKDFREEAEKEKKELYRTPLGGFINHSDNPNCIKTSSLKTTKLPDEKKGPKYVVWNLVTIEDIEPGEELTVCYTFYKI